MLHVTHLMMTIHPPRTLELTRLIPAAAMMMMIKLHQDQLHLIQIHQDQLHLIQIRQVHQRCLQWLKT